MNYTYQSYIKRAKLYSEVVLACQKLFQTHPEAELARKYAADRISPENQKTFQVGFFPPDELLPELYKLINKDILSHLNLIYSLQTQMRDYKIGVDHGILSQHNLIMPYHDYYGNIIALVGRTVLSEEDRKNNNLQKYKYTSFHRALHLFGLHQAKLEIFRQNKVILVEGQIDCMTGREYGILPIVSLGGTAFTRKQFNLIRRLTDQIYLLLDNDEEGNKAELKITNKYKKDATINKIVLPKNYKDLDIYLRKTGNNKLTIVPKIGAGKA